MLLSGYVHTLFMSLVVVGTIVKNKCWIYDYLIARIARETLIKAHPSR